MPFCVEKRLCFPSGVRRRISVQSWKTFCQFSNWPSAWVPLYFGEKVYPGKYFNKYAVLGNDVCIVDKQVVALYRERVEKLAT